MKARKKGTQEWKEYREVFGPDHVLLGLETLGYWQSDEDYCKEHCIPYDPESPFNNGGYYKSEVLPLECFDLWEETDWPSFRREAAKDIVCAILSAGMEQTDDNNKYFHTFESLAESAVKWADELIKCLKDEK